MPRPIDADELEKELQNLKYSDINSSFMLTKAGCELFSGAIDCAVIKTREAPTIENAALTAATDPGAMEWLSPAKPGAEAWRECSACGAEVEGIAFPFCPYCGRKARNGVTAHE